MNAEATTVAAEYAAHGWALVPIPKNTKGPRSKGWNLRENCNLPKGWAGNVGLAHAYSSTCAIDFDRLDDATAWLTAHGIDAQALLTAPSAVRISSGRPNRAKLLYRLETPLRSLKLADGALELRCATSQGTTCQDVLPGSTHPVTGQPYVWEYGDELVADWRHLPELPAELRSLWESLTAREMKQVTPVLEWTGDEEELAARLRAAVAPHDPDCGYDEWLKVGMALHYASAGGNSIGLDAWDEWSAKSAKYPGRERLEGHWASFRTDGPGPKITLASLTVHATADLDLMDDLSHLAEGPEVVVPLLPPEQHKCTDLANANRINRAFGHKLMVSAGSFYQWTGTHWRADSGEAEAARCASQLSSIVRQEVKAARARAEKAIKAVPAELVQASIDNPRKHALKKKPEGQAAAELTAKADALDAWSVECEMLHRQNAAVALLRKVSEVEPALLDRDPWALNCLSGTIDLRTGAIRPHNPADYITRCCPVEFDPHATAPRFEAFVLEVMSGDATRAAFLQRWFGYACTGDVSEQRLVCHIGPGGNGKGTLLGVIDDVLGPYSGAAPPGILMSSHGDRHPTEIADLRGRRLVTASETEKGAELREGFVKQATGGDKLKARFCGKDFFEFNPTHKLQLLTNDKPVVHGGDYSIWRRLLLVDYAVRFGPPEHLASGQANRLRDNELPEKLKAEREGVFRWLVEGAAEWKRLGLQPPDSVLEATAQYQSEQDRVRQFVGERCDRGLNHWAPWGGADGLYPAYGLWCKESGYKPMGKTRFIGELARVVPTLRKEQRKVGTGKSRTTMEGASGLRLRLDEAGDISATA